MNQSANLFGERNVHLYGAFKKRFSVLLALGLVICTCLPACAAEPDSETDVKTAVSIREIIPTLYKRMNV